MTCFAQGINAGAGKNRGQNMVLVLANYLSQWAKARLPKVSHRNAAIFQWPTAPGAYQHYTPTATVDGPNLPLRRSKAPTWSHTALAGDVTVI